MTSAAEIQTDLVLRSHSPLAARMVTALLTAAHPEWGSRIKTVVDAAISPPGVWIEMPGVDGRLFLSIDSNFESVWEALSDGASGILTVSSSPEDVERALESMAQRGAGYLPVEVLRRLTQNGERPEPEHQVSYESPPLTGREAEVLRRLARGESNGHMADAMGISYHTVRSHMRSLATKLGTPTRSAMEARARALAPGLDSLEG